MIKNNFKVFDVVKSNSGHDKNYLYIVIKVEDKFVYLANGKNKKLENLKKKNYRHINLVGIKNENSKNVLKNLKLCVKLENSRLIETLKIIKGELNV